MTKKNEVVEVFVELLESKLDEDQLFKCANKEHLINAVHDFYDDWFVIAQFHLNEKGQVTFPIGVEQVTNNSIGYEKLATALKDGRMQFITTEGHTGKEEKLNFNQNWFSAPSVSNEELEQVVEKIKCVLDSEENNGLVLLYTIEDNKIYYLTVAESADKLVSNHDCTYDTMLERKKRADYALELLEIEDAIYHLSQKRKRVKAALERTNFSFTSDRNRFLK